MEAMNYYYDHLRRGISSVVNGLSSRLYGRCDRESEGGVEAMAATEAMPQWGYEAHDGPAKWAEMFPAANGESQSPIDLRYEITSYDG